MSGGVYGMDVCGGCVWIQLRMGECITDLGWGRLMSPTPCRTCVGLTAKLSRGFLPASPLYSSLSPCQDLGFLLLSLHGLFHFSWLANSFWVFSSTKWGESIESGSRLSLSQGSLWIRGLQSLEAVSSWEEGYLEGGWVQGWVSETLY